jgi:DNA mismatch repair protein MutL
MQFKPQPNSVGADAHIAPLHTPPKATPGPMKTSAPETKKDTFFRTMTAEEYRTFSQAVQSAPQPKPEAAIAAAAKVERREFTPVREHVILPQPTASMPIDTPIVPTCPKETVEIATPACAPARNDVSEEMEQTVLPMPEEIPWRMVGELYNAYILVEQGEEAFLIDKHAAHERILFEKLKANQEDISSQMLLAPIPVRLDPAATAELLNNREMLAELGFEIDEFGSGKLLLRQIPMDLSPDMAAEAVEALAADLANGRREEKSRVRDEILHTVACKAAIKAGWKNDEAELLALVKQVMANEDLKYCPHGRPICITLSKKQLEKQFRRTT